MVRIELQCSRAIRECILVLTIFKQEFGPQVERTRILGLKLNELRKVTYQGIAVGLRTTAESSTGFVSDPQVSVHTLRVIFR